MKRRGFKSIRTKLCPNAEWERHRSRTKPGAYQMAANLRMRLPTRRYDRGGRVDRCCCDDGADGEWVVDD